eukprot:c49009_g1_i1 orf=14-223(-)
MNTLLQRILKMLVCLWIYLRPNKNCGLKNGNCQQSQCNNLPKACFHATALPVAVQSPCRDCNKSTHQVE